VCVLNLRILYELKIHLKAAYAVKYVFEWLATTTKNHM